MSERTRFDLEDGVAWIGMDDGKVNALSESLIGEIDAALDRAEAAGAVVLLSGRPGIFSAGFDLKTFAQGPQAGIAMVRAGAELVRRLLAFPRPVVTACTGHAYPAGAFLMLAADVRFGAAGPFRIGMNEVAIGLTVPEFAVELARHRLAPPGFARVTTAQMFDPEEARRLGYLDHVVEASEVVELARQEAKALTQLDAASYVGTKARVNREVLAAISSAIERELAATTG